MRNILILTTILLTTIPKTGLYTQTTSTEKTPHLCNYNGGELPSDSMIFEFEASEEITNLIKKICDVYQVNINSFEIRAADVPNAAATIKSNKRFILYSRTFFNQTGNPDLSYWEKIAILAHEIGHHFNYHTLKNGEKTRQEQELEADKFAGGALYKLGANKEQALMAIERFATEHNTPTHPRKRARKEALLAGYEKVMENIRNVRVDRFETETLEDYPEPKTIPNSVPTYNSTVSPTQIHPNKENNIGRFYFDKGVYIGNYYRDSINIYFHGKGKLNIAKIIPNESLLYEKGILELEGEWVNGVFFEGKVLYRNGKQYEGTVTSPSTDPFPNQILPDGEGKLILLDGSIVTGIWNQGELVDGKLKFTNGEEIQLSRGGFWVGTRELENGDTYSGEFKFNKPLGTGFWEFKNGDTFKGECDFLILRNMTIIKPIKGLYVFQNSDTLIIKNPLTGFNSLFEGEIIFKNQLKYNGKFVFQQYEMYQNEIAFLFDGVLHLKNGTQVNMKTRDMDAESPYYVGKISYPNNEEYKGTIIYENRQIREVLNTNHERTLSNGDIFTGECSSECIGEYTYSNGNSYFGVLTKKNYLKNGKGELRLKKNNHNVYRVFGKWHQDHLDTNFIAKVHLTHYDFYSWDRLGTGSCIYSGKVTSDYLFSGQGKLEAYSTSKESPNLLIEGSFKDNKPWNNTYTLQFSNAKLSDSVKNGELQNNGIISFNGNDEFIGTWNFESQSKSYGIYHFNNRKKYIGEMLLGYNPNNLKIQMKENGFGKLFKKGKLKKEGYWENGRFKKN